MFELKERDGLARICELTTPHGKITTPALLPVVNPNQMTITPKDMKERFGVNMLITNSYIIWSTPDIRKKVESSGIHSLLDFDGPIMTDSGTFQNHVYGDVKVDPVDIVKFQASMGTDVGTTLDIFSEPTFAKEQAEEAVAETVRRARDSVAHKGKMLLAGTVQGGVYPDVRERCAQELSRLGLDVHPIGGVVPLLESYRFADIAEIIIASKKGLNPSRPVHLFGAGHPMVFPMAVLLGCDMFDSASYAKFAREDRIMYPTGTKHLPDLHDLACHCPVCSKTSIDELRRLPREERTRLIAGHNLHVCLREIKNTKNAIHEGSIWELVEMRARAHPALLEALHVLKGHKEFLERFEPASRRGAFFYCGPESYDRPTVSRYQERFFSRYRKPNTRILIGFEEAVKPYSRTYAPEMRSITEAVDASFIVSSFFGPVPIELDEYYPIAQSVTPKNIDKEVRERMTHVMERHAHQHGYPLALMWDGEETLEFLKDAGLEGRGEFDLDLARCRAVLDMQFGKGAGDILRLGKVELVKSRRTGKIRNVLIGGAHALSMRATDGRFTLKLEGAKLLRDFLAPPGMRVVIEDEPAEFAARGNNVFAKFVSDCDPDIRPGDDVMVVNTKGALAAVGRALLNREEMLAFKRGIAVRVKDYSE
ncbi:MAG TPA: tRNA guanosine(15) transglycosylase TgtA [Thermoplasmata archaeon]